jgi:hypothetical protein
MAEQVVINTIEELKRFLNKEGYLEIVERNEDGTIKTFFNVFLDEAKKSENKEIMQEVVNFFVENKDLSEKSLELLNNLFNLSQFNLLLDGLNLCATIVGFAIMNDKLDKMSEQIAEVVELYKEGQGIYITYELRKILSEHSNMLDCRKKQKPYTEEQMRELVAGEHNVLELLIDTFLSGVSSNRKQLLFSILSLASMFSASIRYFDEIYYFENKEALDDGEKWYKSRNKWWHMDHKKWVSVFDDRLSSKEFINKVQDLGLFEMRLNTVESDWLYIEVYDQIRSLKQDIEDNQNLIIVLDDRELVKRSLELMKESAKDKIESVLEKANVPAKISEEAMLVALAS